MVLSTACAGRAARPDRTAGAAYSPRNATLSASAADMRSGLVPWPVRAVVMSSRSGVAEHGQLADLVLSPGGNPSKSASRPAVETLRHNEPRRIDNTAAERRWPAFCRATTQAGFCSYLALPSRTAAG
jgi:hypothetical protein